MNVEMVCFEEGFRSKPYKCSNGYPTFGYGIKLADKNANIDNFTVEIPEPVAKLWTRMHLQEMDGKLSKYDWFLNQSMDVQSVLISMAYQMGVSNLLKFKNMIAALSVNDMETAVKEALDSKWARKDSPGRAERHARVIGGESIADVYRGVV